ncbi:hypothetical protein V5799_030779 [Amblyomma americanum]|uniref:Uncharacterized protein n=1 Tax=Amblyomma americanum TaxID=6943 RepID=A0AAQ4EMM3_AMBAM
MIPIQTGLMGVAQALIIKEIRVPARPLVGSKIRLDCIFDLEEDALYSVKWFKDQREFYRFLPGIEPETMSFPIEGIRAFPTPGQDSSVTLELVNRSASGRYRCEVSSEAPSFRTVADSKDLLVVEPPGAPRHLQVVEAGTRSVKLQWSRPLHDGNSAISRYTVQHTFDGLKWHSETMNMSLPIAPETTSVVRDLRPATTYSFRVFAENSAGSSVASPTVNATTTDEALGGPPTEVAAQALSAQSVKITWKPPRMRPEFADIRGYYVGYRPAVSAGPYLYEAVDARLQERQELLLTSLSPATRYSVVVQAFSHGGAWPRSDEVIVETFRSDLPWAPLLKVSSPSSTSVSLTWEQPRQDLSPVRGYQVKHREAGGEWNETHVPGVRRSLTVDNLKCGSRHQFAVRGYNEAGAGNMSEVVSIRTIGSTPVAPDRQSLLQPNVSSVLVMLDAWHDGGCPITQFAVQYKRLLEDEWTALGTMPSRELRPTISDLSPATTYSLLVKAHNAVGATEAEYEFTTLPEHEEIILKMDVQPVGALGGAVSLFCSHDFEGVPLYSVKWFKDDQEFYRFVPSMEPPATTYKVESVKVNELHSNASSVHLEELSVSSAGTYRCEVSSGPPLYRTAADEKDLVIAERLPVTPRLSTDKEVYQAGDTVHLSCTSVRSKPPMGLFLSINDQPVDDTRASLDTGPDGLQSLTVRTSFLPEEKKSEVGRIRVKCAAVTKHLFEVAEKDIKVQPSTVAAATDECLAKALAIVERAWAAFSEGQAPRESAKQKMREDI